jgi:type IV secretion system protein VirB5
MVALLCLFIAIYGVGGMYAIGSQSKFTPFVYERGRNGEAQALGPAVAVSAADPTVLAAEVKRFIEDARLVTPDVALQRKAVDRVYARMVNKDAAAAQMNVWFQQNPPFQRAEKIVVNTTRMTAMPLTKDSMQVEGQEDTSDRKGSLLSSQQMRAIVTYRVVPTTAETTVQELDLNPARVFVSSFSWTEIK